MVPTKNSEPRTTESRKQCPTASTGFSDDVLFYHSLCIVDYYWRIFKSFSELHRFSLLSPINKLYFCNPLRCFRSVLGGVTSLAFFDPFQ